VSEIERGLTTLSIWFDEDQLDGAESEGNHWHRILKVAEEAGEVCTEMIGWTGRNPRKGKDPAGRAKLEKELLDTAVAALGALEHLYGNPERAVSMRMLERHVAALVERSGRPLIEWAPLTCAICGDEAAYCDGTRHVYRVAIDPSVDVDSLDLTAEGKALAHGLQTWGGTVLRQSDDPFNGGLPS
jgi:hypothetical protein